MLTLRSLRSDCVITASPRCAARPSERSDGARGGEAALPAARTCLPYPRLPGTHSGESRLPTGPLGSGPAPLTPPSQGALRPDGPLGNKSTDTQIVVAVTSRYKTVCTDVWCLLRSALVLVSEGTE